MTYQHGHGSAGGVASIGGRSMTIFSWSGLASDGLVKVADTGYEFETKQAAVNGGLCDGCTGAANTACADVCPFNSDEAPPKLDDRSDAKGPEPECTITGVLKDGSRLAFVGLERTGGIIVYDVTSPSAPVFQDYLNVRNWMGSSADITAFEEAEGNNAEGPFLLEKALNDGPESFAFIPAADSPIPDTDMLLAVTPLAGRLSAYRIVESAELRADDGACPTTADCPYLSLAAGGSALKISTKKGGLSEYDPFAVGLPGWVLPVIIAAGVVALLLVCLVCCMVRAEKKGKPVFTPLDAPPAAKKAAA
jgi:hypothetical protein